MPYRYRLLHRQHKNKKIFTKMLVMILIKGLILQTMNSVDHYPEEEIRK